VTLYDTAAIMAVALNSPELFSNIFGLFIIKNKVRNALL